MYTKRIIWLLIITLSLTAATAFFMWLPGSLVVVFASIIIILKMLQS